MKLIDTQDLLLITVFLFGITGFFMLLAFNIRKTSFYLWLSAGCFSFALGWALFVGRFFYGKNLLTLPLANVFILALPILINYGIRNFFEVKNYLKYIKRDICIVSILFLHLWLTLDHPVWPGLSSSLINSFYYFSITREISRNIRRNHQIVFKLIKFANSSISFILFFRFIILVGLLFKVIISYPYLDSLFHLALLINIFAVHVQVLCFPLLDFIRAQTALEAINQQLAYLAERDGLTGLFNRRTLNTALESLTQNLDPNLDRNLDQAISVVLLDIDHFKKINDQYGHLAGDQVLIHLSKVMSHNCRPQDIIVRYGGEEFILLLPKTTIAMALQIAERLRHRIATTPLPNAKMQLPEKITASFGVSQLQPGWTSDQLLHDADRSLYQAKEAGRNCVYPLIASI